MEESNMKQAASIAKCLRCRLLDAGFFLDFNPEDGGGMFLRNFPFKLTRLLSQKI
jgi:hypothetical protein